LCASPSLNLSLVILVVSSVGSETLKRAFVQSIEIIGVACVKITTSVLT
jgi:hypothetical protein